MSTNIFYTVVTIVLTFMLIKTISFSLGKIAGVKGVSRRRLFYIIKFFNIMIYISLFIVLATIWGVKFNGLMVFLSSIFAVIGIALFAQWSILSNLTSSIIIFFTFPAKVGDRVKVLDGDDSITGEIKEITPFQIEIEDDEHNTILYPNNLFLQKPIVKLAKKPIEETPTH
ncbi:mechanosensitive ion channel domain-containing protein [Sulfurimonas marina]|uniref:Mechanosensitive ion channel family protein n=1 Tax=Sulfurimonas marina TaxID=2590551 RepID=A0A7M1AUL5_9BACT|nr:mechanosensitive ion channel family protein [Sulfurimonas marina]QOP41115.1 mechanosensitive ion channel family protein [Sulfurimonas marina]